MQDLQVGLSDATNTENNPKFKDLLRPAQIWTGQLVRPLDRLELLNNWNAGAEQCGRDPAGALRLGHDLQVRVGPADLPDHERYVEAHARGQARQVRRADESEKHHIDLPVRKRETS